MRLALYLVSSFLVAILCMAYGSPGPEQMIVDAIIVWGLPAMFAVGTRKSQTALKRYAAPTLTLAAMIFLMWLGQGVVVL